MFNSGKVTKDFLKFRKFIRSNNLSVKEQFLIEYIFEYHNVKYGYAFPKFEDMMQLFNTSCRNTISKIIKHLEELNILKVDRTFKNNRYYIIGIEEFLNGATKKTKEEVVEVTGEEVKAINENEEVIKNYTNFGMKEVRKLLHIAKNKVEKVIDAFEYSKSKEPDNIFYYTIWALKNGKKKEDIKYNKELKFNNFEPRIYDYNSLERKLLGWE